MSTVKELLLAAIHIQEADGDFTIPELELAVGLPRVKKNGWVRTLVRQRWLKKYGWLEMRGMRVSGRDEAKGRLCRVFAFTHQGLKQAREKYHLKIRGEVSEVLSGPGKEAECPTKLFTVRGQTFKVLSSVDPGDRRKDEGTCIYSTVAMPEEIIDTRDYKNKIADIKRGRG